jgi:broad specificity phosphatase PhoE
MASGDVGGVVVLVRHGRTELNAAGKLRGRLDPALDDVGRKEVAELARTLALIRPLFVISSPLRRARETALAIAGATGVTPVVDLRLADRDYGRWTGRSQAAVEAEWGSVDEAPGVEPAVDVATRAYAVLDEQRELLTTGNVALVAHDAVNRFLLHRVVPELGPAGDLTQPTACWNLLSPGGPSWIVRAVGRPADAIDDLRSTLSAATGPRRDDRLTLAWPGGVQTALEVFP